MVISLKNSGKTAKRLINKRRIIAQKRSNCMKTRKQRTLSTRKVIGIIALIAVIGFSFTACEDDDGSDGGGSPYLGQTPTLSGKVYVPNGNSYKEYSGSDLTVSAVDESWSYGGYEEIIIGQEGTITNGQLNFTLGIPENLKKLDHLLNFFMDDYQTVRVDINSDAQGYILHSRTSNNRYLEKRISTVSGKNTTEETVYYLYVDKDCTISRKEIKGEDKKDQEVWKFDAFNLELKAGWNTIYAKYQEQFTEGIYVTCTYSLRDPLKWVIN